MTSYIIATTPRTGSWLLCGSLRATGVAGRPGEYGPAGETATWHDFHGFRTHREYFSHFPALSRTPNGVIGVKLIWYQFVSWGVEGRGYLASDLSTPELIRSIIGPFHVVRLTRKDRLRQAISLVRALQTGVWSRTSENSAARHVPARYDPQEIERSLLNIQRQEQCWETLLTLIDRPTLRLTYEEVAADHVVACRRVLDFLGLHWRGDPQDPVLQSQTDQLTEEWLQRARRDIDPRLWAVTG